MIDNLTSGRQVFLILYDLMKIGCLMYAALRPWLFRLSPEQAHHLTLLALQYGPWRWYRRPVDPAILGQSLWGRDFSNPIGLSAGFDKDAAAIDGLLGLGFGFIETGSVTPRPQIGNEKPRVFRCVEQEAVINRLGFNNKGLAEFQANLNRHRRAGIVGINLGKNKDTEDPFADYITGIRQVGHLADYIVLNISSPKTPGLRALQNKQILLDLIKQVQAALAARKNPDKPPLLVKIAPDLTDEDKADIADIAIKTNLDGLIIANTTITRPDNLPHDFRGQTGGLSGKPLFASSTRLLAEFYSMIGDKMPLIGVGGIRSGQDAYDKIRAGASLVQLYTALIYQGPGLIAQIKKDLAELLHQNGFHHLRGAVGKEWQSFI